MNRIVNLFRIAIHPEAKDEFLGVLSNFADLTKEMEKELISFYAFRSPEQENIYLILEIFASNQGYLKYLNSATYKAYQEVSQPLIQEQSYIRLSGTALLEKLKDQLPKSGSGLRFSLFQQGRPDQATERRLVEGLQEHVLSQSDLHACYLGFDQQSPEDWYQIEIFSSDWDPQIDEGEGSFQHDEVGALWQPQDLISFSLGIDVVATKGVKVTQLEIF